MNSNRVVVCYPAGSGGSFVASALQSIWSNRPLLIDPIKAHCHDCLVGKLPNISHGDNTNSFEQELQAIKQTEFFTHLVWRGHYRNLPAMQETIKNQFGDNSTTRTYFVKIEVEPDKRNHVMFTAGMIQRKVAGSFSDLTDAQIFDNHQSYLRAWYWIENYYTRKNTVTLTLQDVFVQGLTDKISDLLSVNTNKLKQLHESYLFNQHRIHGDLLGLLT